MSTPRYINLDDPWSIIDNSPDRVQLAKEYNAYLDKQLARPRWTVNDELQADYDRAGDQQDWVVR
jgi:hypothetical protein